MNNQRRKELKSVAEDLGDIKNTLQFIADEEQMCFDNLPESIACSERGEEFEENIEALEDIVSSLEDIIDEVENLI